MQTFQVATKSLIKIPSPTMWIFFFDVNKSYLMKTYDQPQARFIHHFHSLKNSNYLADHYSTSSVFTFPLKQFILIFVESSSSSSSGKLSRGFLLPVWLKYEMEFNNDFWEFKNLNYGNLNYHSSLNHSSQTYKLILSFLPQPNITKIHGLSTSTFSVRIKVIFAFESNSIIWGMVRRNRHKNSLQNGNASVGFQICSKIFWSSK